MLRVISSSALSLVLFVTLMWGGCISCPQFFMFPTAHKNCCDKAGKCERPTKSASPKECKRMPLEQQNAWQAQIELGVCRIPAEALCVASGSIQLAQVPLIEHPPPDLTLINSTLLI